MILSKKQFFTIKIIMIAAFASILAACGGSVSNDSTDVSNAAASQLREKRTKPGPHNSQVVRTIVVDGFGSDWDNHSILTRASNQTANYLSAKIQDGDLCVYIQGKNLGAYHSLFLDTDNNPATGYKSVQYPASGADFLFSGGLLYINTQTGTGWNWAPVSATTIRVVANSYVIEARIPLAALGINLAQSGLPSSIGLGFLALTNGGAAVVSQLPSASVTFAKLGLTPTQTPTPTPTPIPTPIPGTNTVTYTGDNTTIFANPERGFYSGQSPCAFNLETLRNFRNNQNISLVLCDIRLNSFVSSNISSAALAEFDSAMSIVRQAGLKAIVRFAYSWDAADRPRDTSKTWVLAHINQLKPYLQSNADVISTMQAGFIGTWGEWYSTDHFGDNSDISGQQWLDRKAVVDEILKALPASRAVQLRTPKFKKNFYGETALSANEAFTQTNKARVGHHNDCFLANATDFGTYENVALDKAWLAQETLYTPQGGETCAESDFSGWTNADKDMRTLHYSYLNINYHPAVLNSWGSNIDIAKRNLGYRFVLTHGSYSNSATSGGSMAVNFSVRNDGYAAPYNGRDVYLILRNTSTNVHYKFKLNTDPRRWASGTTTDVNQTVTLSGVPPGSYALALHLADPAPLLANRVEYSIRLANANVWEATTGFNLLNHTVNVTSANPGTASVFLAGDSTMAKYGENVYPLTGWGDRMANFYKDNITFHNHADSGTSSKRFVNDGRLNTILAQIKPMDYLFISFGHNDCCSSEPTIKVETQPEYKQYLREFIDGARSKGAYPVLVTPTNTYFLFNNTFQYNTYIGPYAVAMRELAVEKNTPLIDLATKSTAYLNAIGSVAAKDIFMKLSPGIWPNYPNGLDDEHFQDKGATEMARLVAEGIKENKLEPLASSMR
jgi:lysophospholipase L1-like esterase